MAYRVKIINIETGEEVSTYESEECHIQVIMVPLLPEHKSNGHGRILYNAQINLVNLLDFQLERKQDG